MKNIKQIKKDIRVQMVERNSEWSKELENDYPDSHPSKYLLWLNDGWIFDDGSHINGADTINELNELLTYIIKEK